MSNGSETNPHTTESYPKELFVKSEDLIAEIKPADETRTTGATIGLDEIANEKSGTLATESYSRHFRNEIEWGRLPQMRQMRLDNLKKLKGQIVVDLGAGVFTHAYEIASQFAKGYIAIEPIYPDVLTQRIQSVAARGEIKMDKFAPGTAPVPYAIEKEDALTFLRRLPSESVSVTAFGLRSEILDRFGKEYVQELRKEIARVLHPDGVFICDYSVLPLDESFKSVSIDDDRYIDETTTFYTRNKTLE